MDICQKQHTGQDAHRRLDPPADAAVRAGRAVSNMARCRSTRRRAVRSSGKTSSRETERTRHPRSCAIADARRTFRSRVPSVAWRSGTTDFTSTTTRDPVSRWNARMSIVPRSPRMLNETSVATSQPASRKSVSTASVRSAWAASRSRSSASPCQRMRTLTDAPRAAATRTSVRTVAASARPRSIRAIVERETPTSAASPSWVSRRRRRRARSESQTRTASIAPRLPAAAYPGLIALGSGSACAGFTPGTDPPPGRAPSRRSRSRRRRAAARRPADGAARSRP